MLCFRLPHSFLAPSRLTSSVAFGRDKSPWTQFWTLLWLHLPNAPLSPTLPAPCLTITYSFPPSVSPCLTLGREKMVRLGESSVCSTLWGPRPHRLGVPSQAAAGRPQRSSKARKRVRDASSFLRDGGGALPTGTSDRERERGEARGTGELWKEDSLLLRATSAVTILPTGQVCAPHTSIFKGRVREGAASVGPRGLGWLSLLRTVADSHTAQT